MRFQTITCAALIAALACLGGCRAAALEVTPEDWATSRYEVLFEKVSQSPTVLRAITRPERATDPDMKTLVGIVYRVGFGVEKDLPKAAELLSAACEAGQMRGCRDYGKVLIEQNDPAHFARAAELFNRSCEAGIVFGCFDMATSYLQGIGVAQDTAKAIPYVDRACVEPAERICAKASSALASVDAAEGLQRLGKPSTGLVHDHCRHNRRSNLGRGRPARSCWVNGHGYRLVPRFSAKLSGAC
jgi:hypothetical protein